MSGPHCSLDVFRMASKANAKNSRSGLTSRSQLTESLIPGGEKSELLSERF